VTCLRGNDVRDAVDEIDLKALETDTRSTKYPGKPFGYEYNMDMAEIERDMIAEGFQRDDIRFIFEASKRYTAMASQRLTMRQRQDLARWLGLAWAGGQATSKPNTLTKEELEYLCDRLTGVNDPVGQSALGKLSEILADMTKAPK
jgi:hypothetical protein